MKKLKIIIPIIAVILFFAAFKYEPKSSMNDMHYQLNKWAENPLQMINDLNPFIVIAETDTILDEFNDTIFVHYAYNKQQVIHRKKINFHKEKQKIIDIFNKKEYRDYMLSGITDDMIYNCLLFAPAAGKIKTIKTNKIKGVKLLGFAYKKSIKIDIWCNVLKRKIKLVTGDKRYGLQHIIEQHTPLSYIKRDIVPSKFKHLFLKSNKKYILSLLKRFLQSENLTACKSLKNAKHIQVSGVLNVQGLQRKYILIYSEKSGKIITFYPEFSVEQKHFNMLKNKGFFNYVNLKEKILQI